MTWRFGDRDVQKIGLIDDQPSSRRSFEWIISDSDLEPVAFAGPLPSLDLLVDEFPAKIDALVCDHHLRVMNYASFDGAQIVAASVKAGQIAILCTRYTGTDIDNIRPYLPFIPVLVRPDELNEPEELEAAFCECVAELEGRIAPTRKRWRSQVVVERTDPEGGSADVSIPAWTLEESIRLRYVDLPNELLPYMIEGARFHANVNLGAEHSDQLFIVDWEIDSSRG